MNEKHRDFHVGASFAKTLSILLLLALTACIFILSYMLVREYWDEVVELRLAVVLPWYIVLVMLTFSFLDCFNYSGRRYHMLLYSAYIGIILSSVIMLSFPYVIIGAQISKKVLFVNGAIMVVALPIWLKIARELFFKFRPPKRTLLITDKDSEAWMMQKINSTSRLFSVEGTISPADPGLHAAISEYSAVLLGSIGLADKHKIEEYCAANRKTVLLRPEYTDIMLINAQTEQFDDLMIIHTGTFGISSMQKLVKRILDIVFSSIAIVVTSPVMLICALLIYLEDKHNPFYTQERYTYRKRSYNVIKLRTMIPDAEKQSGPILAEAEDKRITKVGRVLRKLRIDELPQFINILMGDMSIVGPRPERPYFYEEICAQMPEFAHRLSVKAGLTGMAQVNGRYSTDAHEKLMLDLMYIQNYSFMLDVKIVIETVRAVFEKRAADGVDNSGAEKAAGKNAGEQNGTGDGEARS